MSKANVKQDEVIATLTRIAWSAKDSDFRILAMEFEESVPVNGNGKTRKVTSKLSAKGEVKEGRLSLGMDYRLLGKWNDPHPKFGKQFQFEQIIEAEQNSRHGIIEYLSKYAPNCGPSIAGRLYDAFGSDAIKILRIDPLRASKAISGLTYPRAVEAADALKSQEKLEDTRVALTSLFAGRHFPRKLTEACIEKWGILAPSRIKRDPLSLIVHKMPGCGWDRVDRLYNELGLPPGRLKRQMLCMWHLLRQDRSGHTWKKQQTVEFELGQKISGCKLRPKRALELGVRSRWLSRRREKDGDWVSEHKKASEEQRLHDAVMRVISEPVSWPSVDAIKDITEHQREQLRIATAGPMGILTGDPGAGKTHTLACLIRECIKQQLSVAVCAPTGKAATRCTGELSKRGVNIEATTQHRLLGVSRNGHDGEGWGFLHDEDSPLPFDVIVIDEMSMESTTDGSSLFGAFAPETLVLMTGDLGQLPPVSHGAALRDLIEAGLPHGHLTEIHRNAGDIVRVCQEIESSGSYNPSTIINEELGLNAYHIECRSPFQVTAKLKQLIENSKSFGIDPKWDIQVLTALNSTGALSRQTINKLLQPLINPRGRSIAKIPFRLGDKVICTKNGWLERLDTFEASDAGRGVSVFDDDDSGNIPKEFVANGEIGEVIELEERFMLVELQFPKRTVIVKFGKKSDEDSGSPCDFSLAYAITAHKAQGSQAPVVISLVDDSYGAGMIACREWWKTAISRSERLSITIGKRDAIERQCKRVSLTGKYPQGRKTFLAQMIKECLSAANMLDMPTEAAIYE